MDQRQSCISCLVEKRRIRSERSLQDLMETWDDVKKRLTLESNGKVCEVMRVKRYKSLLATAQGTTVHDVIRLQARVKQLEDSNAQLIQLLDHVRSELLETHASD